MKGNHCDLSDELGCNNPLLHCPRGPIELYKLGLVILKTIAANPVNDFLPPLIPPYNHTLGMGDAWPWPGNLSITHGACGYGAALVLRLGGSA
jgi:hypothetical protein